MDAPRGRPNQYGFHLGELSVQERVDVQADAQRLAGMLDPVELRGGIVMFLADRVFAVLTARDPAGMLWTSPVMGDVGFLEVIPPTTLRIHSDVARGDPLDHAWAGQPVGLIVMEFATRRRVRINGILTETDDGQLTIEVEQAYGNCPQYIHQRTLPPGGERQTLRHIHRTSALSKQHRDQIISADTFFLGTTHPTRGNDTSHRGGPAGFVRATEHDALWPDYPGNNMFNSLGNLEVDPTAALLFIDFDTGATVQLSGTAEVEWDHPAQPGDDRRTGRFVRFHTQQIVAGVLTGATDDGPRSGENPL